MISSFLRLLFNLGSNLYAKDNLKDQKYIKKILSTTLLIVFLICVLLSALGILINLLLMGCTYLKKGYNKIKKNCQ